MRDCPCQHTRQREEEVLGLELRGCKARGNVRTRFK